MQHWRFCSPVVRLIDSHNFDEMADPHQSQNLDPNPQPHQSEKSDPDPQQCPRDIEAYSNVVEVRRGGLEAHRGGLEAH